MIRFKISTHGASYECTLPSSTGEVKLDYLKKVSKEIKVSKHHVLVAILYRESLMEIISINKKKNETTTSVIPILVKGYKDELEEAKEYIDCEEGDRVIITGTDLSRGIHVSSPVNELSFGSVHNILTRDTSIIKSINTGSLVTEENRCVYCVEFKIIPCCDIKGVYKNIEQNVNEFIKPE